MTRNKVFIIFLTSLSLGWFWGLYSAENIGLTLWKNDQLWVWLKPSWYKNTSYMDDFYNVYDIVKKEYFSQENIQEDKIVQWAIKGMIESLWDKHSEYMSPEITKKFEESLSWDFEGIWAVVEKVPWGVQVERVIKWSPALENDIRAWDIILSANEKKLEDLDLYDAVDLIKWPQDTEVILEIMRSWQEKILTKTVIRKKIHIPSVEYKYLEEENYAYISLNMFWETTAEEFISSLREASEKNVSGLILDLRNNGWWYLESAVQILSEFIPNGETLVKTRYRDNYFDTIYKSQNLWEVFDKKIVILINENSASASEITAAALREYNLAILLGKKSYGKWSVQQPFEFSDGSLLKLTVAKWFSPKGINIDDEGVSPDIEIGFLEEDYENKYDRQLEEAKKLLNIFIEKKTLWLSVEAFQEMQKISEETWK